MDKCCSKCGASQSLDQFYKETANSDGRGRWCKSCIRKYNVGASKAWRWANHENFLQYRRERYARQKEELNKKNNQYLAARVLADPAFHVLKNLRTRVCHAVAGRTKKAARTMELVGCSIDQLLGQLEIQFQEGMSWENYGQWHVDHKKPCAKFNLSDPAQQKQCFHYSNLQPLWADENRLKGAR